MGKKLKLSGFWVFVHHVHAKMVTEGALPANTGLQAAVDIADEQWEVKAFAFFITSVDSFQKMSTEAKNIWKLAAKKWEKTKEFQRLRSEHRLLVDMKGPGLGVPRPHDSFFTKSSCAQSFMQSVIDDVTK